MTEMTKVKEIKASLTFAADQVRDSAKKLDFAAQQTDGGLIHSLAIAAQHQSMNAYSRLYDAVKALGEKEEDNAE